MFRFIVLLSAIAEELRGLAVTEMPDVPRQPARSATTWTRSASSRPLQRNHSLSFIRGEGLKTM